MSDDKCDIEFGNILYLNVKYRKCLLVGENWEIFVWVILFFLLEIWIVEKDWV